MALDTKSLLMDFLNTPLGSGDKIMEGFACLPGAICGSGQHPLEKYVYIPGARSNRIVLVAHTDTVWDEQYSMPHTAAPKLAEADGSIYGTDTDCGIGADDRAGCAMLWALRDSGHSLLLVSGEEQGKRGAKYLRASSPKLFRELNRHQFMIELDWRGTGGCLYNQVDNTKRFQRYILEQLGFQGEANKGGCDLQFLCRSICGVNLGIGYHGYHTPKEYVSIPEWENTYRALSGFLAQEHPHFHISICRRLRSLLSRCKKKALHSLGKRLCKTAKAAQFRSK